MYEENLTMRLSSHWNNLDTSILLYNIVVWRLIMTRTHGACKDNREHMPPEYIAWASMISRCYSPSQTVYKNYGGRGITVCKQWRDSYPTFLADMGKKPSPLHTLDRIDNAGNYTPGNCRWATKREQAENRMDSIWITYKGKRKVLKAWARYLDVNYAALRDRYLRGWTVKRMIETPLKGKFYEDFYER
jgi:hypothetical protein